MLSPPAKTSDAGRSHADAVPSAAGPAPHATVLRLVLAFSLIAAALVVTASSVLA